MDSKARFLTQAALIAAIYVVLLLIFQPISFREGQIRISEILTVLPYFTPAAIPGLFIGCLIGNYLGGAILVDIIFGSLASLVAAVFSYLLRKNKYLVPIPSIIINAVVVGLILKYGYGVPTNLYLIMLFVGFGQFVSSFVLGLALIRTFEKHKIQLK
ncbi:putative membrane protein [Natranaerovirga hydrolytica]|uniref:Putative membrane protein n=1 Tax=Natranaerovirga hydrolytica TaxID=680378 RepID=A0A4R1M912_9FIRM|nr:QueT transporter family protein [Natranaerovirga hydrolytica]TCK87892.1 putative membrane protein [Natranaerovirga hydrolytica]